jgi:hypothetical protein
VYLNQIFAITQRIIAYKIGRIGRTMAQVVVKVIGGQPQNLDASTVGDVKRKLNASTHVATVNGESVDDSYELEDNEFVSLAPSVKGAARLSYSQALYIASLA